MSIKERFPWQVFWKFFFYQAIAFNFLALAVMSLLDVRYNLRAYLFNEALLNFFVLSLPLAAFTSYRFCRPIQRMINKALRISSKRYRRGGEDVDDSLLDDEVDGYADLDVALNRIQRKMRRNKDLLAQEREETRAFISSVQEGVISVSPDQKVTLFNSQFATHFLSSEQVASSSLTLKDIFRLPEVLEGFSRVFTNAKVHRFTMRSIAKVDGQTRHFAVSVHPLRKPKSGDVYGAIGMFHDITELKRAEQVRIDFVGNASHELRTPMTSIKGYVDTLSEDVRAGHFDQAEKFLKIISNNVDRLIALVGDLLSISTMESGAELKLEPIKPLMISEQVISELMVLASEKGQSIQVKGDAPSFMADPQKVEQVLRNLVSNAVKYMPQGGTVSIVWENDGANSILKVIDDGPGIPEEHHHRLFERFYRIDKGRTRDAGGTGLGLAIVKHIMQSHGGTVTVRNGVVKGSEFICTFPLNHR